jgi:hypothetical protein
MRPMTWLILALSACRGGSSPSTPSTPPTDTAAPTGDTAAAVVWIEDRLAAEPEPMQDVLFVVDNSCSMEDNQGKMNLDIVAFFSVLMATTVDWHVGITSTDADPDNRSCSSGGGALKGRLQEVSPGGPLWLDPSTANPIGTFGDMVQLGTTGSGCEQGLAAAKLSYDGSTNAGFYREGASTHVIVVSDEQDQSEMWGSPVITLGEFQGWFGNLHPDSSFSSIVCTVATGGYGGCPQENVGSRYMEVSTTIGGVIGDISEDSYVDPLQAIADLIAAPRSTYALSVPPDAAQLTVAIDRGGVLIPAVAAYDARSNTVRFADDQRPLLGDVIVLTYPAAP